MTMHLCLIGCYVVTLQFMTKLIKSGNLIGLKNSSATCFIKFNDDHFIYLQPIELSKDKDVDKKLNNHEIVDLVEDDHFIIEESNVYSSTEILEGIYKNTIPLYISIMSKCNSLIELVAKDKEKKSEFKIKTKQYPYLPILHANSFAPYSPMKFPKLSSGYNKSFTKKRVSDDVKFSTIKSHIYQLRN